MSLFELITEINRFLRSKADKKVGEEASAVLTVVEAEKHLCFMKPFH